MEESFRDQIVEPTRLLLEVSANNIVEHRDKEYPNEAVGILCANGDCYPLINQARSPNRFEVSQTLVGEALNHLKYRDRSPVAVYHSHPEGESSPSKRDERMMETMPGALFVIIGRKTIAAWIWDSEVRCIVKIDIPVKVSNVKHD